MLCVWGVQGVQVKWQVPCMLCVWGVQGVQVKWQVPVEGGDEQEAIGLDEARERLHEEVGALDMLNHLRRKDQVVVCPLACQLLSRHYLVPAASKGSTCTCTMQPARAGAAHACSHAASKGRSSMRLLTCSQQGQGQHELAHMRQL